MSLRLTVFIYTAALAVSILSKQIIIQEYTIKNEGATWVPQCAVWCP